MAVELGAGVAVQLGELLGLGAAAIEPRGAAAG
jgi:hypothetical protein